MHDPPALVGNFRDVQPSDPAGGGEGRLQWIHGGSGGVFRQVNGRGWVLREQLRDLTE